MQWAGSGAAVILTFQALPLHIATLWSPLEEQLILPRSQTFPPVNTYLSLNLMLLWAQSCSYILQGLTYSFLISTLLVNTYGCLFMPTRSPKTSRKKRRDKVRNKVQSQLNEVWVKAFQRRRKGSLGVAAGRDVFDFGRRMRGTVLTLRKCYWLDRKRRYEKHLFWEMVLSRQASRSHCVYALGSVLVRVTVATTKHHDQSNLGRKEFVGLHFNSTVHHWRKLG